MLCVIELVKVKCFLCNLLLVWTAKTWILSETRSTVCRPSVSVLYFPSPLISCHVFFFFPSSLSVTQSHQHPRVSLLPSISSRYRNLRPDLSPRLVVRGPCKAPGGHPPKIAWKSNSMKPDPPVSSCLSAAALVLVSPPPCCPPFLCLSPISAFLPVSPFTAVDIHLREAFTVSVSISAAASRLSNTREWRLRPELRRVFNWQDRTVFL